MIRRNSLGFFAALGIAVGTAIGVANHEIALGVGVGGAVGLALGALAARRKREHTDVRKDIQ